MRGPALQGKTIRRVEQMPMRTTSGATVWVLLAVEFTDGSWLRFTIHQRDNPSVLADGSYGWRPGRVTGDDDNFGVEPHYWPAPVRVR